MNIVLGASGQVGSAIVQFLSEKKVKVKAVVRNPEKADLFEKKGVEVAIADYYDLQALQNAVKDGEQIFVITPDTTTSNDILGDTKKILENYRKAIQNSGIKTIFGLSSGGAQYEKHERNTGNLLMSNMLEHEFISLSVNQVFIRPSYFYSNWLLSLDMVKEKGILPSFFPADLKFYMNSPIDVARFIADKMVEGAKKSELIELVGPEKYSANDVAAALSENLGRKVTVQEIPRENWERTMNEMGFTEDVSKNFIKMTEVVADGIASLEGDAPVSLGTSLSEYIRENIKS